MTKSLIVSSTQNLCPYRTGCILNVTIIAMPTNRTASDIHNWNHSGWRFSVTAAVTNFVMTELQPYADHLFQNSSGAAQKGPSVSKRSSILQWLISCRVTQRRHQSAEDRSGNGCRGTGRCLVQLRLLDLTDYANPAQHLVHGFGRQRLGRVPHRAFGHTWRLRHQVEHVIAVPDWLRTETATNTNPCNTKLQDGLWCSSIGVDAFVTASCDLVPPLTSRIYSGNQYHHQMVFLKWPKQQQYHEDHYSQE